MSHSIPHPVMMALTGVIGIASGALLIISFVMLLKAIKELRRAL